MIQKGTRVRRQKTNERVSWKRLEQKWSVMQRRVYQRQMDELKRQLIDVWCGLEQSMFYEATGQSCEEDFERVSVL